MNISNRLKTIAKYVSQDSVVADIGTDHAWIPIYLVKNNICQKVIASDINKGPIERARENIEKYSLKSKIETRLGSGLTTVVPREVDIIIVAGMGGILTIDILENSMEVVKNIKRLILQPQLAQEEVRKWLHEHGFYIKEEDLVYEDEKWYEIIIAEKGIETYTQPIFYEVGKRLFEVKHPLLKNFVNYKKKKYQVILDKTSLIHSERAKESKIIAQEKLKLYEELEK